MRTPSGIEADVEDVENALHGKDAPPEAMAVAHELVDTVNGAEKQSAAAARLEARQRTMQRLQSMGPGIGWRCEWRPHLVVRKRKKDEPPQASHGVTFRREGEDCYVEAGNGVAFVSFRLPRQAKNLPNVLAVVPAAALAAACQVEAGGTFWFGDGKVWVLADDVVHEFFLLQPDLPFPGQNLRKANEHQRSLAGVGLDAEQLARVQKALGCECLAVRLASKGVVSLYPGVRLASKGVVSLYPGDDADGDPDQIGFLALIAGVTA